MRIAFLLGHFPALPETFILNQITGLLDLGHSVSIFAWKRGDTGTIHEDVSRYRLIEKTLYFTNMPEGKLGLIGKALILYGLCLLRSRRAALRIASIDKNGGVRASIRLVYGAHRLLGQKREFDIIHCHFGPRGVSAVALREAGLFSGRVVTTFHGTEEAVLDKRVGWKIYKHLFLRGEWFLPVSDLWRRALIEIGAPAERTSVHHMGVATRECVALDTADTPLSELRLLSVCRLIEKKGLRYALEGISRFVQESRRSVTYDIVGDGELRGQLEQLASELRIGSLVRFHGERTRLEVQEFLARADIFLQPSVTVSNHGRMDREGIPVALMEAMAAGLPVISTRHAGIPELVGDGVSGILVDEKDGRQLADVLTTMADDPDARRKMGLAARKVIDSRFEIGKLNSELESLYLALLHGSSPTGNSDAPGGNLVEQESRTG